MTSPNVPCLVPSHDGYVILDESTSRVPVRLTREGIPPIDGTGLSYGRYFRALKDVLLKHHCEKLVRACAQQLGRPISSADLGEVRIFAEKHGSDYHPARIEVMAGGDWAIFVMNVALTPRGRARLGMEFEVLEKLNNKHGLAFLPRPYFQGKASLDLGRRESSDPALMFLADWFHGYHEFHLSIDEMNGMQRVLLWDTDKGSRYLSREQADQVCRQAAMILTVYYDVETYEQIFTWHHAAGDFVVKVREKTIDVKMVTARQYAPMIEPTDGVSPFEALLFFLLNLSLRMRLDRLDGTGPVAWADEACLEATLRGFLEGLKEKMRQGSVDAKFVKAFMKYGTSLNTDDLSERFHALVDAYDPAAPDLPVIRPHLSGHVHTFSSAFLNLTRS